MTISNASVALADHAQGPQRQHKIELELLGEAETARSTVERFIQVVFKRAYGARLHHFLPYLLCMREEGSLLAALGIRPAAGSELFLETYLDTVVEQCLAARSGHPIDRSRLVEVGNLASAHGGGARALIITLTAYLQGAGYEWAVFTATPKVRNNFAKLGIELIHLAPADGQRLGPDLADWGSYYDQAPLVVAANVAASAERLRRAMAAQQLFTTAQPLWHDAYHAGRQGCLWQPPRRLAAQWPQWMLDGQPNGLDFSI